MSKPTKYNMTKDVDIRRWFMEMEGYFRCGEESNKDFIHHGTDLEGRKFAVDAFHQLRAILGY